MYNMLENFLANPWPETFEQIRHNSYFLAKIFRENEDLAKKFFGLEEWDLIEKEIKNLDNREKDLIRTFKANCEKK